MIPFKCSTNQKLLVSWAGLRGASSSVFAIMAVAGGISMKQDLFHIVFMVSLFSVAIQGTLLPMIARKLDMIDDSVDVCKTFNDYQEETSLHLMEMQIPNGHPWINQKIKDVSMPTGSLALMIKRGNESVVTKGDTLILEDDTVILSVPPYTPSDMDMLQEKLIGRKDPWCNKSISELRLGENELIVMIIRGGETIIPNGTTVMKANDLVVTYK
jgi:cell volume regulation protein A